MMFHKLIKIIITLVILSITMNAEVTIEYNKCNMININVSAIQLVSAIDEIKVYKMSSRNTYILSIKTIGSFEISKDEYIEIEKALMGLK